MSLIEAIDAYKKSQGIKTDKELALRWNINHSFISRIRAGTREPGNKVWKAMCQHPRLIPAVLQYFVGDGE